MAAILERYGCLRFEDDQLLRETPLTFIGPVYVRRDMRDGVQPVDIEGGDTAVPVSDDDDIVG